MPAASTTFAPPSALGPFTPAEWLASLTEIGGRYALLADRRLWIGIEDCPGDDAAPVMAHLTGRPDRREAVKREIEQRQSGAAV